MPSSKTWSGQGLRWAGLAVLSGALAIGFDAVHLPAAFLIGPLVTAIVVRLAGVDLVLPRAVVFSAQAVVGGMIGAAMTPSIVSTFLADWPILFGVVGATVIFASITGWALSRYGVVPGTTGVWGSSPGAALAMVILAESHGGDVRLVAFMQYLRVIFVASAASIGARLWLGTSAVAPPHVLFPPFEAKGLAITLVVIGLAGAAGHLIRLPGGALFGSLLATAVLHGTGTVDFVLPPWLLIAAYAGLGWNIGLRFTRSAAAHAARATPWIIVSIVLLMLFSGGLAMLLVVELGIDPLTAFLATSPGGMDTVAIIAASTPVDVSFVMALQVVRFFVLIMIGPSLSRLVASRLPKT